MSVPIMVATLRAHGGASEGWHPLEHVPASTSLREMPPAAVPTYARLMQLVLSVAAAGEKVPCLGPGAEAWTADDPTLRALAADRCLDCPLAIQCRTYAQSAGETEGVWGGWDPDTDRRAKVRAKATAQRKRVTPEQKARRRERERLNRAAKKAQIQPDIVSKYSPIFEWDLEAGSASPTEIGYPMSTKTTTKSPANINADGALTTGHFCRCDCNEIITTKAIYRPGHDARHAGLVAREIAENPKQAKTLLAALPSAALQAKATNAAARLTVKTTDTDAVAA